MSTAPTVKISKKKSVKTYKKTDGCARYCQNLTVKVRKNKSALKKERKALYSWFFFMTVL